MDQGSVPGNCWRLAFGEQPGYRRSSAKLSMFVVVALVNDVTTTVVDVVDVVAVRDRNMTAAIAVGVFVLPFVNGVLGSFALVVVAVVSFVQVSVVDVVDVVAVRDRNMTAAIAVFVFVSNVFGVHRAHYTSLPRTVARRTVSTPVRVPY